MSSRNLVRAFKTATGLTPLQYQQRLRLEFAGSLLQDSRLTLESIAERCGFADARHFRRLWKSVFHVPPGRARRSATAESATGHSRVTQGRATPDSEAW
jgi:transcriptional regulator GlxA family with amidase domain